MSSPPRSVLPRCDSAQTHATTSASGASRTDATRPFTASVARSGNLLTVHVHHGKYLDALLAHGGVGDSEIAVISSFVVVSVGDFASEAQQRIKCLNHSSSFSSSSSSESGDVTLYAQHYSPFTATRVVESSNAPAWNELLALTLPFDWRERQEGALPSPFSLKLELVQRGPSQQEDYLLATAIVPLASLQCHVRQVRLALQFPGSSMHAETPKIYVSLRETTRGCFNFSSLAADQLEVLIQRFVPLGATVAARTDKEKSPKFNSLALGLAIAPSSGLTHDLTQLFSVLQDKSQITVEDTLCGRGLTPSSVTKRNPSSTTVGAAESFQWHFPLVLELENAGSDRNKIDSRTMEIALYDTSDVQQQVRIGAASFPLNQFLLSSRNGTSVALNPPVPIYSVAQLDGPASSHERLLLGHLHATVRWWSAAAWDNFLRDTPSRRVVSSNRNIRKQHALLDLEWMGALLRGLNRFPVSSFCDEGGLSSVLAGFLAASSSGSEAVKKQNGVLDINPNGITNTNGLGGLTAEMTKLLTSQVAHLQAESAAQRQQIERLQTELDARLKAVQTCGKELVALRRELRLKDQHVKEMKTELEKVSSRERLQVEQLMVSAAVPPYSSGVVDSRVHQQLTLVLTKYKDLEQQHQETKAELDAAKRALELYQDLETRHAELEQAHLVQATQVQREKKQVTELKRAVRLQEKVIRQFEDAVSLEAAEELAQRAALSPSYGRKSNNSTSFVAPGSTQPLPSTHTTQEDGDRGCNDALLAVRVRVRVLEEQLAMNARDAASEIGRLKMRILELEMSGHRGS